MVLETPWLWWEASWAQVAPPALKHEASYLGPQVTGKELEWTQTLLSSCNALPFNTPHGSRLGGRGSTLMLASTSPAVRKGKLSKTRCFFLSPRALIEARPRLSREEHSRVLLEAPGHERQLV